MNESAARPSHGPENAVEFPPIRVFVVDRSKQTVLECWPEFGSVLNQDAERYIRRMSRGGAMAKDFRPNAREFAVITRLDHAKEAQRSKAFHLLRQHMDELSNLVAMKLIEQKLVETTSKRELEEQIHGCLAALLTAEEFDVQYQVANFRALVPRPHPVSLYITAFVIEKLIEHRSVVDIYGTDEEIYHCVNNQVLKQIPIY